MTEQKVQLHTAGLLLVKNRKLLLAYSKNKNCFYLPGGKIGDGETVIKALCREISEELNIVITESDIQYYTHISAPAFGEAEGVIMEQDCFLATTDAQPVATAEISEVRYFSLQEYKQQLNIAPGALMILEQLKKDNLID